MEVNNVGQTTYPQSTNNEKEERKRRRLAKTIWREVTAIRSTKKGKKSGFNRKRSEKQRQFD